jgi:hypothetical protein
MKGWKRLRYDTPGDNLLQCTIRKGNKDSVGFSANAAFRKLLDFSIARRVRLTNSLGPFDHFIWPRAGLLLMIAGFGLRGAPAMPVRASV